LAYAIAACNEGIKVANRFTKGDADLDYKASKAMSALHYNLGGIYKKRAAKSRAIKHYKKAAWWRYGDNSAADKKLKALGWSDHECTEAVGRDRPCGNHPQCCYE